MISRIRRFWLVLLSALAAIILVLAPTSIATAATSGLPLWYQRFQAYVDQYNSNENTVKLDKYQKLIYQNPEYVQALQSGQAARAPKGTGIIEALEGGYSDFYVTGSDGVTHNVKTIQALEDIVSNANARYADFAAEAKNAGITVRQLEALKATRLTSTSSQFAQAAKTSGVTASELISSSSLSTSTALTPVDAVDLPSALSTLTDVDGKVVDTTGTVISEKLIDKGVVKSALKFLGKVGDVGFAWQLATMAGQALVKFTGATEEECTVYRNKIARFLLGISDDTCTSYDDSSVSPLGAVSYDLSSWPCLNFSVDSKYRVRVCMDSFAVDDFTATVIGLEWPFDNLSPSSATDFVGYVRVGTKGSMTGFHGYDPWTTKRISDSTVQVHASDVIDNTGQMQCSYRASQTQACETAIATGLTGLTGYNYSFQFVDRSSGDVVTNPDWSVHASGSEATPTVSVEGSDGNTYTATGASQSQGGNVSTPSVLLPTGVTPKSVTLSKSTSDAKSATVGNTGDVTSIAKSATLDLIDIATGKSCYVEAQGCADWAAQVTAKTGTVVTSAATQTTTTNSDMPFKCMSGSAEVAIGECTVLKNAFTPAAKTSGETASDPETGEALDTPTQEVTDTSPSFANCVATDVSWNPVSWVTVPVKCALQWAFVPDEDVITTSQTKIKQATNSTIITKFQDFFNSSVPAADQDDSSCEGPEFHAEFAGFTLIKSSHPMSVCSGSGLEWAPFLSRTIIILFCLLAALFSAVKGIQIIVGIEHRRDVGNDKL